MRSELDKYGIQMPAFSKIGGILANELSVDEAACKSSDLSLLNSLLIDMPENPRFLTSNTKFFCILFSCSACCCDCH